MEFDEGVRKVLGPLVAAAHAVVRGLEDEEVPASLRAVRAKASRRLPPPLAKSLLRALNDVDWLRAKVAEEVDDLDEAGQLYIDRPEGWEERLNELASQTALASLEQRLASALKERNTAKAEADRHRQKQRETAKAVERLESGLRHERDARRESIADARASAERSVADQVRTLTARVAELEQQLGREDELRRRIEWLRAVAARRSGATSGVSESGPNPWVGDPVSKARLLDEITTAAAGRTDAVHVPERVGRQRLALPVGVRPDSGAAVAAVLGWRSRITLALDGYNIAGEGGVPLADPSAAREFVRRLVWRMQAAAAAPHEILVVYDSKDAAEQKGGEIFVPWADEELRRLANLRDEIVVISNDREVITDTSASGAVALWTTALLEWAG